MDHLHTRARRGSIADMQFCGPPIWFVKDETITIQYWRVSFHTSICCILTYLYTSIRENTNLLWTPMHAMQLLSGIYMWVVVRRLNIHKSLSQGKTSIKFDSQNFGHFNGYNPNNQDLPILWSCPGIGHANYLVRQDWAQSNYVAVTQRAHATCAGLFRRWSGPPFPWMPWHATAHRV